MNDRQRGILLHLVAAEDPLTSDYLAQQLDVSSRTIKSDMVVLSAELRENGAELPPEPGIQPADSGRRAVSNPLRLHQHEDGPHLLPGGGRPNALHCPKAGSRSHRRFVG